MSMSTWVRLADYHPLINMRLCDEVFPSYECHFASKCDKWIKYDFSAANKLRDKSFRGKLHYYNETKIYTSRVSRFETNSFSFCMRHSFPAAICVLLPNPKSVVETLTKSKVIFCWVWHKSPGTIKYLKRSNNSRGWSVRCNCWPDFFSLRDANFSGSQFDKYEDDLNRIRKSSQTCF